MHFSHYFTPQLNKRKEVHSRASQVCQSHRILSRQESRKPHCSLQSAISVAYFAPWLTHAGEWKREQKCLCTVATLFFPLSVSQSQPGPRTKSSPSPLAPSLRGLKRNMCIGVISTHSSGPSWFLTLSKTITKTHLEWMKLISSTTAFFLASLSTKFDGLLPTPNLSGLCRQCGCISL